MSGAKTEEPTPRRLRKAREEGDTGASVFASQAIALVAAVAILPAAVAAVALRVEERLRDAIQRAASVDAGVVRTTMSDLARTAEDVATLSLPLLAGVAVVTVASTLVQTGGLVSAARLSPRLGRLQPFGDRSGAPLFTATRSLIGGAVVAWIGVHELCAHAADLARTSGRLAYVGPTAAALARGLGWKVALAGLVIAAVDVAVVRTARLRRLRMSRDEVRRERREAEGDPLVKDERERTRTAMLAAGALAGVRGARVVVCDGERAAYALRYDDGDEAPVVITSRSSRDGDGVEGLLREARVNGVRIVENAEIAGALATTTAGERIPEALYDAVAEVLRHE